MVATPPETPRPGQDDFNMAREQMRESVNKAPAPQQKADVVKDVIAHFLSKDLEAEQLRNNTQGGKGNIPVTQGLKEKELKKNVMQVFEGIKFLRTPALAGQIDNNLLGSQKVTEKSIRLLRHLDDQVGKRIPEEALPFVYPLISKSLQKELSFDELKQEFNNLKASLPGSSLLKEIGEVIVKTEHETSGRPEAELKEELGAREEDLKKDTGNLGAEYQFDQDWRGNYERYVDLEDKEFIHSLYSKDNFTEYVNKLKQKLAELRPDIGQEELNEKVSHQLEVYWVKVLGKLYNRVDDEPRQLFEQIITQDPFKGIQATSRTMRDTMFRLARNLMSTREDLSKVTTRDLLTIRGEAGLDIQNINIKMPGKDPDKKTEKMRVRLNPLLIPKQVDIGHFVEYLGLVAEDYVSTREYLHNARAIYHMPAKPADQGGFYGQLAGYAEHNMESIGIDGMLFLPDSDLMMMALRLYDKKLDEEFAMRDWIHTPTMFTNEFSKRYTKIESDVLDELKGIYGGQEDRNGLYIDEHRLKSALSMAIGASRGVFFNEVEKASFADPPLTPEGGPNFLSYYTKDSAALTTLNPLHDKMRWQSESSWNPILFLPVEGFEGTLNNPWQTWDHKMLWDKMQGFKESFLAGRQQIGDGKLFVDFMMNIGNVGGPLKRAGWRLNYGHEPYYIFEDKAGYKIDVMKTWKALEYIGYDPLLQFVNEKPAGMGEFLQSAEDKPRRTEFFKYV
ncbi:MAG: hypothetical protein Q7S61_01955, partial [bacterium]|nr:hypothetical protein [bacterium]